jgi:dTDP-4-amino-4,6-dideoxygalactose transaminase
VYGSADRCPTAADLFARHLAIPMHANLAAGQIERVVEALRKAVVDCRR